MDSISTIFFGRHTDTLNGNSDPYAEAYDGAHHSMLKFIFGNLHMVGVRGYGYVYIYGYGYGYGYG